MNQLVELTTRSEVVTEKRTDKINFEALTIHRLNE